MTLDMHSNVTDLKKYFLQLSQTFFSDRVRLHRDISSICKYKHALTISCVTKGFSGLTYFIFIFTVPLKCTFRSFLSSISSCFVDITLLYNAAQGYIMNTAHIKNICILLSIFRMNLNKQTGPRPDVELWSG